MSKRYSDLVITDEIFDESMEKLAEETGFSHIQFLEFVKELSKGFTKQENENGYEEWVSVKTYPNHCIDCVAATEVSVVAYEFANGFMLFGERGSMWD